MRPTSLRRIIFLSLVVLAHAFLAAPASAAIAPGRYTFAILAGAPGTRGYVDDVGNAARFDNPGGIAADALGNVYLSERDLHVIRKISPEGVVSTLAGSAGQGGAQDAAGAAARFKNPSGLAIDAAGNVFVADSGNQTIRRIDRAGNVITCAGRAGEGGCIDGPREIARLGTPTCLAVDRAGNLFVYDGTAPFNDSRWLRKIAPDGSISSLTISPNRFIALHQICVDPAGRLYAAIREAGPFWDWTRVHQLTPTSEEGQYSAAYFEPPDAAPWITGIGCDATGQVFVRGPLGYTTNLNPTFVYAPDAGWQTRDYADRASASREWDDFESYDFVAVSSAGRLYRFRNDGVDRPGQRGAVEIEICAEP